MSSFTCVALDTMNSGTLAPHLVLEELRNLDFVVEIEPLLVRSLREADFIDHERPHTPQRYRRQLEFFAMDSK